MMDKYKTPIEVLYNIEALSNKGDNDKKDYHWSSKFDKDNNKLEFSLLPTKEDREERQVKLDAYTEYYKNKLRSLND